MELEPRGEAESAGVARARLDIRSRQGEIVELVRRRGYASIEALSELFRVSTQTIRRDIKQLADLEYLVRHHGGAGLPAGADRLAYSSRRVRNVAAKQAIAREVARAVPDGASLFIDIGTTMEVVAEALLDRKGLRVVTNHLGVATLFSQGSDFEINLAGGLVRNRDQAVMGERAVEFVEGFKVGYGLFSIGAIDSDGLLLDYDYRDMRLSLTAMKNARQCYFAADSSKFDGDAMVKLGQVSDMDALFTDAAPPPAIEALLRDNGVALHVAPPAALDREGGRP